MGCVCLGGLLWETNREVRLTWFRVAVMVMLEAVWMLVVLVSAVLVMLLDAVVYVVVLVLGRELGGRG